MPLRRAWFLTLVALVATVVGMSLAAQESRPGTIVVSIAPGVATGPIDGRLLVILSKKAEGEPRFQVSDPVDTQQAFGLDVEGALD